MENYTKYALKSWKELADLLENKDNLFVVTCNKCFKAFETLKEPECDKVLALVSGLDKRVTGVIQADFLCNENHTGKALQLPEGTENVIVLSCGLGVQTVAAMPRTASVRYTPTWTAVGSGSTGSWRSSAVWML